MDAHFDGRHHHHHDDDDDDTFFAEIERRLLLLISEGEEEEKKEYCLFYNPSKTLSKRETTQPLESYSGDWNNPMKLHPWSTVVSSKKKKISGTGVFIPQFPSASSVITSRSDQKQLHPKRALREVGQSTKAVA